MDEGGEEVVTRRGRGAAGPRSRAPLGQRHLVLELEDQALGGLLADAGDAGEAGNVAGAQRLDEVGGLDAGEDAEGDLGPDAGDVDEPLEERLLLAVRKP